MNLETLVEMIKIAMKNALFIIISIHLTNIIALQTINVLMIINYLLKKMNVLENVMFQNIFSNIIIHVMKSVLMEPTL